MITNTIAGMIDNAGAGIGKIFAKYKLGTEMKAIQDNAGERIIKTLAAGDVSDGVATVTAGEDFTSFGCPLVISSEGAPRAVTKVEQGTGTGNKKKLLITATSVTATDKVVVTVYP